jgi:hypothetical protein
VRARTMARVEIIVGSFKGWVRLVRLTKPQRI